MWYFMPIPYVIINTGSKYRLTFYVKQRQKRQPLGAAFLYAKIVLAILCFHLLNYIFLQFSDH